MFSLGTAQAGAAKQERWAEVGTWIGIKVFSLVARASSNVPAQTRTEETAKAPSFDLGGISVR